MIEGLRTMLLVATIGTVCLLSVRAQSPPVEQVTVTAHASPVPFKSLARTIEVISRKQIESLPVESLSDLIRYASSVDVSARGPFGIQSDLSIRGSTFDQVVVLVDGQRLNDPQTGHHNADIPVSLADIDRVEILSGSGSSLHGADAVGGVINIVTRKERRRNSARWSAGQYGLLTGSGTLDLSKTGILDSLSLWGNRSSGFAFDRDFRTGGLRLQGRLGSSGRFQLAHSSKRFGADGFYGPSPSREWTNQTLVSAQTPVAAGEDWTLSADAAFRTHGDHFLWDVARPGFAENFHRDYSLDAKMGLDWHLTEGTRISLGGTTGGDWIRSNNLGDHQYRRVGLYTEVEKRLGNRILVYPAVRYDGSSAFAGSWSPSLSGLIWIAPSLKLRAFAGRAFRIPTFTERFYSDPNHLADSGLGPERSIGLEAGFDWLPSALWQAGLTLFSRHLSDAIDWVRVDDSERWRTANIRRLRTDGGEISIRRQLSDSAWLGLGYTYLDVRAGTLDLQSKYVLRNARHSMTATAAFALLPGLTVGHHLSFRRRCDGHSYWAADLRLTQRLSRHTRLYAEVTNYLNQEYEEVPGVATPPRWFRFGLEF